ncbi:MAG: DUF4179 domain-containing protein [Oscillospiraceae bacterium]|nr:DUF4179 domain-containing protein [Oscillospiraceae bacterium]
MNRQLISVALGDIDDEHITAALRYRPEINDQIQKHHPAKRILVISLAAVMLLAFAITAYAAGWFRSFFAAVNEEYSVPDPEKYEHAGELSNKAPATVDVKTLPDVKFTLSESFYDGEDLLLAYSLESMQYPVQFGFGPEDDGFDQLWLVGRWYIDAQLEKKVAESDFNRICEELRGKETTGFIVREAYLGDHIRLTDGTDLGPMLNIYTIDGNMILECQDGLPDAAKNRDQLELVFTVRECLHYYYKDGETLYRNTLNLGEAPVTVTIPNNK